MKVVTHEYYFGATSGQVKIQQSNGTDTLKIEMVYDNRIKPVVKTPMEIRQLYHTIA